MPVSTSRGRRFRLAIIAAVASALLLGFDGSRETSITAAGQGAGATDSGDLAKMLLDRADLGRGVCLVLGRDEDLAVELARASELLVHVRDPRAGAVTELRQAADTAGLGIDRLVAEKGRLDKLPHVEHMVDFVIATQVTAAAAEEVSLEEILRVLRPDGTAVIGSRGKSNDSAAELRKLRQWVAAKSVTSIDAWQDQFGTWVQFQKPPLEGADDWTHWEHGPDNNPVSGDTVIKAPYMTQFMAGPFYIGMPSITTAAGGRTFLAIGQIAHHRREWDMLNKLIARNGYNGTILWERKLPEGYVVHRSAFIATKETFYMIDGSRCLLIDPATGRDKGEIRIPGVEGQWKWMVMKEGVFYVMAGKPEPGAQTTKGDRTFGGWSWSDLSRGYYTKTLPYGFGDTLAAYDLEQGKTLWTHKEKSLIDSRAMALADGRVYLYCPGQHIRGLAAKTGSVLWTNGSSDVLDLIEMPGRGLTSTPGFRSMCLAVATPEALVIQGQTRMNVVAVSTETGGLLWTKKKITNNPNAIYVDGRIVLGVGPGGSHVVVNPVTGEVEEDLKFRKVACTRLTASSDSFFCRGEGTLRFDRTSKQVLIDGAVRPACNDGAMPAGGMLYIGPWQCDCNLSLIGCVARCSAGDFRFDHVATDAERLEVGTGDTRNIAPFSVTDEDWPTYRGNVERSSAAKANVVASVARRWDFAPAGQHTPTAAVAAGGSVFVAGTDGKVRALDAESGEPQWQFATPAPIKSPPTVWQGRLFVGSGDGFVYCLEAATGRLLWRFRAAPVERHMMVYGALSSTWPVNSGVLVRDGVAYFAAGIIDQDGTYVYAVDAETGKIKWQNNSSGHLNTVLRKGVSAQGNLTIMGDRLLLAGGNQVSPAPFDLETGECLAKSFDQGRPKANHGKFVGVFGGESVIAGGRILYSSAENVSSKGSFVAHSRQGAFRFNYGGVPPAWDEKTVAFVNFKHGKLTACDAPKVAGRIEKGLEDRPGRPRRRFTANLARTLESDGAVRWQSDMEESNKFETVSLAMCPNAVVAALRFQQKFRSQTQWFIVAFDMADGTPIWQHELRQQPLPGGLLVDRSGQVVVTMLDGSVLCLGPGS